MVKSITVAMLALTLCATSAKGQTREQSSPEQTALTVPPAEPSQVEDRWLRIQVAGHSFNLTARILRPVGPGPFPLVVINHGTPVSISDAPTEKIGFAKAARWFVSQGYAVVLALRPGFGKSDGPYIETSRPCNDRDYVRDGRVTAALESAIVKAASTLPGIDPRRIVVVGQSAGGFGVIALADEPPPGVLGVISFAGGRGGDDHEHICSGAKRLVDAAAVFGRANRVPGLWLFAANDHFFPPAVGHAMFQAYQAGTTSKLTFVDLPAFDDDGHRTFARADPSVWADAVSTFLLEVGAARAP